MPFLIKALWFILVDSRGIVFFSFFLFILKSTFVHLKDFTRGVNAFNSLFNLLSSPYPLHCVEDVSSRAKTLLLKEVISALGSIRNVPDDATSSLLMLATALFLLTGTPVKGDPPLSMSAAATGEVE